MKQRMLYVAVKRPGCVPEYKYIPDELDALQAIVDGYIECVTLDAEGLVIVCNEEGRLEGLPHNCAVMEDRPFGGVDFCGTIIILGFDADGEFADAPDRKELSTILPELWQ